MAFSPYLVRYVCWELVVEPSTFQALLLHTSLLVGPPGDLCELPLLFGVSRVHLHDRISFHINSYFNQIYSQQLAYF